VALVVLAWLLASFALSSAGVHRRWFANDGRIAGVFHLALLLAFVGAWVWRRVRREDTSAS
jgi:hypothetical protein